MNRIPTEGQRAMTEYAGFEGEEAGEVYRSRRRTAMRVLVPIAIAAVAATGIAVVPALASDGAPTLPQLTAQQLVAKVLASDTQQLSGTVKVSTDLGIPSQVLGAVGQSRSAAVTGTAGAAGGSGQAKESSNAQAASPQAKLTELLAGEHTLRVAADGPDKQRLALVDSLAEYDLIHNGDQLWAWDSASNQAVHLSAPQGAEAHKQKPEALPSGLPTTPQEAAKQFLTRSAATTSVTVDGTTTVAGRTAYQLSVKPTQSGSTIGEVRIAVDSANGTPLAVVAKSTSGSTVLDVHFTDVSFAKPDAKTFTFTPPKGAKVTEQAAKPAGATEQKPAEAGKNSGGVLGTDWTTVLTFHLPADEPSQALPNTAQGKKGRHQGMPSSSALLKSLGKPVGGGTLISTKVLNVLITDDGRVFAGAVTLPVLQQQAGVKLVNTSPLVETEGTVEGGRAAEAVPAPVGGPMESGPVESGPAVIRTKGLTKRFPGGQLAVDGLDLTVPRGSVFGFLGPNGSGKTTTIRMLMGLIAPTSGVATVLGASMPQSVSTVLPRVGALIEGPALYGFLSGRDNLVRYDSADPTADPRTRARRVTEALDRVGLTAAAGKKARAYSLGMKQRLGLAAALLQPRELLVLDEPTNGLDPQGMREIRALIREVAAEGTTVFLSSHLLDEIEQVCTHAAVMSKGRLVVQGTVAELAARAQGRLVVRTPDVEEAAKVLAAHRVTDLRTAESRVDGEPATGGEDDELPKLCAALVEAGVRVRGFGVERGTLEDAFVALTGEGFDVAG